MKGKPYNFRRRMIIAGLLWLLFVVPLAIFKELGVYNSISYHLPIPTWFWFPVLMALVIAHIDYIMIILLFVFLEFLGYLVIAAVLLYTHIITYGIMFNPYLILYLGIIFIVLSAIWYFEPFKHRSAGQDWEEYKRLYDATFSDEPKESVEVEVGIGTATEPKHTKEEIGRLLNLWQMKYSQAKTEEGRTMANEKIKEYQDEYAEAKARNGTTPVRAKLDKGGDKE